MADRAFDGPLLEVNAVSAGYGAVPVISGVTFTLNAGDLVGLLGANGSGKSTLLGAVTGQIRLSAGQVRICGIDLARHPERAKQRFGYAVDGADLPMELTGAEYLQLVASIRGCGPRAWPHGDVIEPLGLQPWLGQQLGRARSAHA